MWFQVNTNGILSFGSGVSSYTPTPFPISSNPVVAPFWGDVDIRYSGNVYYGWVWHHLMFRFNYHKHFNRPVPLHACLQVPVRITAIIVILIRNTIILTVAKLHSETLSSGLQNNDINDGGRVIQKLTTSNCVVEKNLKRRFTLVPLNFDQSLLPSPKTCTTTSHPAKFSLRPQLFFYIIIKLTIRLYAMRNSPLQHEAVLASHTDLVNACWFIVV